MPLQQVLPLTAGLVQSFCSGNRLDPGCATCVCLQSDRTLATLNPIDAVLTVISARLRLSLTPYATPTTVVPVRLSSAVHKLHMSLRVHLLK